MIDECVAQRVSLEDSLLEEYGSHYTLHYSSSAPVRAVKKTCDTHLKIDVAVLVHVKCAEHMVAEFFRIAGWEEHFIHIDELRRR